MTSDALLVVLTIFNTIWKLFTSWYIPGTNVTPAGIAFFVLVSSLALRIFKHYFGGDSERG